MEETKANINLTDLPSCILVDLGKDESIKKKMRKALNLMFDFSRGVLVARRKVPFGHFPRRFYVAKKRSGSQLGRKFLQRANDERRNWDNVVAQGRK